MTNTEFSLTLSNLIITEILEVNIFCFHFIGGEVKDHRGKTVSQIISPVIGYYGLNIYWASCCKYLPSKDGFCLTFG